MRCTTLPTRVMIRSSLAKGPNTPFYIVRMVIYFSLWFGLFQLLRKASLAEDRLGGVVGYKKMVKYAVFFIVVFAITS